jgi:hypothetical protein
VALKTAQSLPMNTVDLYESWYRSGYNEICLCIIILA